ncbi:helix-turn-helix domain-containing protein, partial [Klebsiella pneumoniae]
MYDKLLTVSDAAKLLGISASTLRRLEENGEVKTYGLKVVYTPGGQRRYLADEIQR